MLPIAEQCREVGFTEELTRLLAYFQPVRVQGKTAFTGTPGEVRNGIFNGNSKEESAEERKVPVVH